MPAVPGPSPARAARPAGPGAHGCALALKIKREKEKERRKRGREEEIAQYVVNYIRWLKITMYSCTWKPTIFVMSGNIDVESTSYGMRFKYTRSCPIKDPDDSWSSRPAGQARSAGSWKLIVIVKHSTWYNYGYSIFNSSTGTFYVVVNCTPSDTHEIPLFLALLKNV